MMKVLLLLLSVQLFLSDLESSAQELACKDKRHVSNDHIVCACDATSCADLSVNLPTQPKSALLVQSTKAGLRFATSDLKEKELDNSLIQRDERIKLTVDLSSQYQSIMGWGGAFTDAATINIKSLSENATELLIRSYYGDKGLQYNFGRVPLGGSDFSTHAYSYDDTNDHDLKLTNWNLAKEDLDYKIPVIKKAKAIAAEKGTKLKLFASPWSPPGWMKENNKLVRGHLKDDDEIYSSYANYTVKFYDAYKKLGLRFWGGTVQNEPVSPTLFPFYSFNSLQMTNAEQIRLIGDHLGPALEAAGYTRANFKLMVGDDSLGLINLQVPPVMKDPKVQRYVSGLGFHWYLSGSFAPYSLLNQVVNSIEDHIDFVLMTEACTGSTPTDKGVDLGRWERGEEYALDIIEDLLHKANGWIDWNLALDQKGGPNWDNNVVDSPIIVDKTKDEFYLQPMYYTLAHFTRFFKPGSIRVNTILDRSDDGVKVVAVHDIQTGHLVINVLNKSKGKKTIDVVIANEFGLESFPIDAKSMNTVVVKL